MVFGVDVAVEAVFLPQNAQGFDHALHRGVRAAGHRAGQKQPFNIIAAVKADGQFGQFPRGKAGPGAVVGPAVDAVAAVVAADVGEQHLEQRDAPAVRGKRMADARGPAAAQAAGAAGALHPARRAGHIVLGAVRQDLEFFSQIHHGPPPRRRGSLKKRYKKYARQPAGGRRSACRAVFSAAAGNGPLYCAGLRKSRGHSSELSDFFFAILKTSGGGHHLALVSTTLPAMYRWSSSSPLMTRSSYAGLKGCRITELPRWMYFFSVPSPSRP